MVPSQKNTFREKNYTSVPSGTIDVKTNLTKSLKSNGFPHPLTSMGLKSSAKAPAVLEKQMLSRVLGIMKKNHIDPQLMNMLRYEIYRIDPERTMLLP